MSSRGDLGCIRGCTVAGEHYAACESKDCAGCVVVPAADGMLICQQCFRRLRRHLEDAAESVAMLRSKADPQRSTWNLDRVRSSSGGPEMPAPIAADLVDATRDVVGTLRSWARFVDPLFVTAGVRALQPGADSEEAFDDVDACAQAVLEELPRLANRPEIRTLADAVLTVHAGEPDWWSVADVQVRMPADDRPRWMPHPCVRCDLRTVKILPPRRGRARRYLCTTCGWEGNDTDDGGLYRELFAEDHAESVSPHDPNWVTLTEAARRVRRTIGTVRGWVVAGELHGMLGRYHVDHVDAVARAKRGEAA